MNNTTIKICLHPQEFTCKEDAKLAITKLSKELPKYKTSCSIEDLINAVQRGQTFIPSIGINKTSRGNNYFEQSELIGIDIDGTLSPNESLNKCQNLNLKPCIGYYTFSQVDFSKANEQDSDKPGWNFRLLFKLEECINDSNTYRNIVSALIQAFGGDTACKDSMRIFYGSKPGSVFLQDSEAINAIDNLTKLVQVKTKKIRRKRAEQEQTYDDIKSLPQFETSQLLNHLKLWRRKLIQSDDHRYNKLSKFIYSLMHLDFLTSDLVLDVVDLLISQDRKLREAYVDSWDKDYTKVAEQLVNWCECNYDERL